MFKWLRNLSKPAEVQTKSKTVGIFSTDVMSIKRKAVTLFNDDFSFSNFKPPEATWTSHGQDGFVTGVKPQFSNFGRTESGLPSTAVLWFATQAFVGYQICALLMQHWLIDKACSMPARDAVRKGYELDIDIANPDGNKIDPAIIKAIKKADKKFAIKKNCEEFIHFGRGFGIRIALFVVDAANPDEYYKNPFNPDAIKPNTYKGISQIDPYWITPELDNNGVSDPANIRFYEPTYWRVSGRSIHYTHLRIFRTGKVADILKPAYCYGGVSIPQQIAERVYAAERTANEAPLLALSKRSTVLNVALEEALLNMNKFLEKLESWAEFRDNFGVKVVGSDEKISQFDTTLSDMDSLIMTQYQLVAAIARVPGTKLLGTQPKGFNSTGEFEESSYHEELESIQENDLDDLVDMHHVCLLQSEIKQQFPEINEINHVWNKLDAMTEEELAALNLIKAQTDEVLTAVGAIDGTDVRNRVRNDDQSGYNDLTPEAPVTPGAPITPEHGGPTIEESQAQEEADKQAQTAALAQAPQGPGGGDPGVATAAAKLSPGRPRTPSVPQPKGF